MSLLKYWFSGRNILVFLALSIVVGTIFYSKNLAKRIALKERSNVEVWVMAQKAILNSSDTASINLATKISSENIYIPIIETNENDSLTNNYINLDTNAVQSDKTYLSQKLTQFKKYAPPIIVEISKQPYIANKYYYGESNTLKEIRYYPLIQLVIVILFVVLLIVAQRSEFKSTQNQVWAGLAKETAHQLGTPVSSLQGWTEVLKENPSNLPIVIELEKDVKRLQLITDRFGKIGSSPKLEPTLIVEHLQQVVDYIKKRAGNKVQFEFIKLVDENLLVLVSPTLFDWVIENLLKNALDAMEGKGNITLKISENQQQIMIDVADTGKGISSQNRSNVFKPGFTTKKRGWGLGLTLSKRIIQEYHSGQLYVLYSELGKGTTFRITLNKIN